MRIAAIAAVALALAAGCGSDDEEYPDQAVENFVDSCKSQAGATEEACRCVIDRLKVTMPYEEFKQADDAVRHQKPLDPESRRKLERAAAQCR